MKSSGSSGCTTFRGETMPAYQGTKRIASVLSYEGLDAQLKKLEGFGAAFQEEMGAAMDDAVEVAQGGAREDLRSKIRGKSTGQLEGSIFGKTLERGQQRVRGSIGTRAGLKAFAQEVGRWYGRRYWRGKFFLYFGVNDRAEAIMARYQKADERIVNRMVVKP